MIRLHEELIEEARKAKFLNGLATFAVGDYREWLTAADPDEDRPPVELLMTGRAEDVERYRRERIAEEHPAIRLDMEGKLLVGDGTLDFSSDFESSGYPCGLNVLTLLDSKPVEDTNESLWVLCNGKDAKPFYHKRHGTIESVKGHASRLFTPSGPVTFTVHEKPTGPALLTWTAEYPVRTSFRAVVSINRGPVAYYDLKKFDRANVEAVASAESGDSVEALCGSERVAYRQGDVIRYGIQRLGRATVYVTVPVKYSADDIVKAILSAAGRDGASPGEAIAYADVADGVWRSATVPVKKSRWEDIK